MNHIYRPEIDGLRAIAILLVFAYHAGVVGFKAGFIGVDIFFVISGYLIIGILRVSGTEGWPYLKEFYINRAARLLPALFFVVCASLPISFLLMSDLMFSSYLRGVSSVALYGSNVWFWLENDYFDVAGQIKPLLHTWSLAVEEQFYILIPPLILLLTRFRDSAGFLLLLLAFVVSLLAAEYASHFHPSANFFLLPFRAWEFLAGGLLTYLPRCNFKPIARDVTAILGAGLIGLAVASFDESTRHPSLLTFLPVTGTVLLLWCLNESSMIGRFMSSRPMVLIGMLSYSIYLWHQPLFSFARLTSLQGLDWRMTLIMSILCVTLAFLTWKYIETPSRQFLRKNPGLAIKVSFYGTFVVFCAGVSGSLVVWKTAGSANPLHMSGFEQRESLNYQNRLATWQFMSELNKKFDIYECPDCVRVLILGDSHSKDVFNTFLKSEYPSQGYSFSYKPFDIASELGSLEKYLSIETFKLTDVVIVAERYTELDLDKLPSLVETLSQYGKKIFIVKPLVEPFPFRFGMWTFSDGIEYILEKQHPMLSRSILETEINETYSRISGKDDNFIEIKNASLLKEFDRSIRALKLDSNSVKILDRMDYICPKYRKCKVVGNNLTPFFVDSHHQSMAGAEYYGSVISEINWFKVNIVEDF